MKQFEKIMVATDVHGSAQTGKTVKSVDNAIQRIKKKLANL